MRQLRSISLNMLVVKFVDILGRDRGLIRQQLQSPWVAWCQQPNVFIPCVPWGHKIGPNWVVNPTQFSVQISFHYCSNNRKPLWTEYWASLFPLCLENTISTAHSIACRNKRRKCHNQLTFNRNSRAQAIHFHNFISELYIGLISELRYQFVVSQDSILEHSQSNPCTLGNKKFFSTSKCQSSFEQLHNWHLCINVINDITVILFEVQRVIIERIVDAKWRLFERNHHI